MAHSDSTNIEFPTTDDGAFDYEAMLEEIGIELPTTHHRPAIHLFNDNLTEVEDIRDGELHYIVNGQLMKVPVTDLYTDYKKGNFTVERASKEAVRDTEIVVGEDDLLEKVLELKAMVGEDVEIHIEADGDRLSEIAGEIENVESSEGEVKIEIECEDPPSEEELANILSRDSSPE